MVSLVVVFVGIGVIAALIKVIMFMGIGVIAALIKVIMFMGIWFVLVPVSTRFVYKYIKSKNLF